MTLTLRKTLIRLIYVPKRGVDKNESDGQHDAEEEDDDAAELVDEEVGAHEQAHVHEGGVLLLETLDLDLLLHGVHAQAKNDHLEQTDVVLILEQDKGNSCCHVTMVEIPANMSWGWKNPTRRKMPRAQRK